MGTVRKLQDSAFHYIADSIRSKNLQTTKYNATEMPAAISALIWRGNQSELPETLDPGVLYLIDDRPSNNE